LCLGMRSSRTSPGLQRMCRNRWTSPSEPPGWRPSTRDRPRAVVTCPASFSEADRSRPRRYGARSEGRLRRGTPTPLGVARRHRHGPGRQMSRPVFVTGAEMPRRRPPRRWRWRWLPRSFSLANVESRRCCIGVRGSQGNVATTTDLPEPHVHQHKAWPRYWGQVRRADGQFGVRIPPVIRLGVG